MGSDGNNNALAKQQSPQVSTHAIVYSTQMLTLNSLLQMQKKASVTSNQRAKENREKAVIQENSPQNATSGKSSFLL